MIKQWLCKRFNLVTRGQYDRLSARFIEQNTMIRECIEMHEMQNAWEQVKQKRKAGRLH